VPKVNVPVVNPAVPAAKTDGAFATHNCVPPTTRVPSERGPTTLQALETVLEPVSTALERNVPGVTADTEAAAVPENKSTFTYSTGRVDPRTTRVPERDRAGCVKYISEDVFVQTEVPTHS
jgi:hypothetical protein